MNNFIRKFIFLFFVLFFFFLSYFFFNFYFSSIIYYLGDKFISFKNNYILLEFNMFDNRTLFNVLFETKNFNSVVYYDLILFLVYFFNFFFVFFKVYLSQFFYNLFIYYFFVFLIYFFNFFFSFKLFVFILLFFYFFLFICLLFICLLFSYIFIFFFNLFFIIFFYLKYFFFDRSFYSRENEQNWVNSLLFNFDYNYLNNYALSNMEIRKQDVYFSLLTIFFDVDGKNILFKTLLDDRFKNVNDLAVLSSKASLNSLKIVDEEIKEKNNKHVIKSIKHLYWGKVDFYKLSPEILQFLFSRGLLDKDDFFNVNNNNIFPVEEDFISSRFQNFKEFLLDSNLNIIFGSLLTKLDSLEKFEKKFIYFRKFLFGYIILYFIFNKRNNFFVSRTFDLNLLDLEYIFYFFYENAIKDRKYLNELKNDPFLLYKKNLDYLKKKFGENIINELLNREDHKPAHKIRVLYHKDEKFVIDVNKKSKDYFDKNESVSGKKIFNNNMEYSKNEIIDPLYICLVAYHKRFFSKDYYNRKLNGELKK